MMKDKLFWVVSGLLLLAVFLTRTCSKQNVVVKETISYKSDTIWLKPDTVVTEKVVTVNKTKVVTKEVPVPVSVQDTNVYNYTKVNYFGDTIAVIDTIIIANNEIVDHKQRVVLLDVTKQIEKVIEKPILVKESIVEKIFDKKAKPFIGVTYSQMEVNGERVISINPNLGLAVNRHYGGLGVVINNYGFNGISIEYKYKLLK